MAEQLTFPFPFRQDVFETFLTQLLSLELEQARLAQESTRLREAYTDRLPLRAIATATKVVRARKKLMEHPREPLGYEAQAVLEGLVLTCLMRLEEETQAAVKAVMEPAVPDMTGGGAC